MSVRLWTASSVLCLTAALASAATPPTLIAPQGAASPRPRYQWQAVAGATAYELRVKRDALPIVQHVYASSAICSGVSCTATPARILGRGDYTWQVRAQDTAGTSAWSAPMAFRVDEPGAPTLVSPVGNITERRPTYTWQPVAHATHYLLRVHGPTGLRVLLPVAASPNCNATACTARPQVRLELGAHRWQVRAVNLAGIGPWSASMAFSVTTGAPTPTSTATPRPTATLAPTATRTPRPTATSTRTATATSTARPTATSSPTATSTARPTATSSPTATSTARPTATSSPTATSTARPTATLSPTATSTARPTATLSPTATSTARPTATLSPTATSTARPTATLSPTVTSTSTPSPTPTAQPGGTTFITTLLPEGGSVTNATGFSSLILAPDELSARVSLTFSGLSSQQTASHVHGPADPGQVASPLFSIPLGNFDDALWVFQPAGNVTVAQQVEALKAGRIYINVHSVNNPTGEIRGHYRLAVGSTPTPTPVAPTPTPVALTVNDAARFLEQASWGATSASIDRVRALGYEGWIDEQIALPASTYSAFVQAAPTTDDDQRLATFQAKFFNNALVGEDQLRQRVGWALSQILVVSGRTIEDGPGMALYADLLNGGAFGNYRPLLQDLTLNPAMGDYLDMANNVRASGTRSANENYAREILQLFSIGLFRLNPDGTLQFDAQSRPIVTYDQAVIENVAKVFTGWTYAPLPGATPQPRNPVNYLAPMVLTQANHDVTAKTILNGVVIPAGGAGDVDLNQALDVIAQHPNVGPFISRQLIQQLVTSNPSPAYIGRVSRVFDNNGQGVRGDLRAVVKAVLLDPEARANAPAPPFGKLKEPVLAMLQLLRALGGVGDGLGLAGIASNMGESPYFAPTVFNYYHPDYQLPGTTLIGPPFQIHTEATVVQRSNWVNTVIFGTVSVPFGPAGTSVTIDMAPLDALAADPATLVNRVDVLLMHGTMSAAMRTNLVTTVGQIAANRPRARVQNALYLVATSAQFNVGR
jgi:uncharacterized protein (DUF1800 family)